MSKSVKMIVGVVAAVAIPFAAPALAGMIMASTAFGGALATGATALGMTATSGLVGAGLGAASAAATGGDIGKGALFGGLGGGLGGLAKAGQSAQLMNQVAKTGAEVVPGAASAAAPVGTGTVLAPTAASSGIEGGLSSYLAGVNTAGAGGAAPAGQFAGLTSTAASVPFSPSPAAVGVPAAQPASFAERFKAGVADGWDKMTSPENISDAALQGGKYLAGSLAAGSGMSSAEEAMMRAQRQELRTAQQANAQMYGTRRDEALKLINEAGYYDPEYMGLQRARQEQLRGARAKQAGLRGLDTSARTAESRRFDLGTSRATGAAYDQGYQSGVTQRTNVRSAGISALPTGYQTTTSDYGSLAARGDLAEDRRRTRARDIGNLFGDFSGKRDAESTGG